MNLQMELIWVLSLTNSVRDKITNEKKMRDKELLILNGEQDPPISIDKI